MKKTRLVFMFIILSLFMVRREVFAVEPEYIGWEGCGECHQAELKEWEKSKHANAFKRLLSPEDKKDEKKQKRLFAKLNDKLNENEKLEAGKDYSREKKCLPCHTTGYGNKGGFESLATTPTRAGVGCEMCHGPGGRYAPLHRDKKMEFTRNEAKERGAVYGSEDEKVCRACHDNPDSPIRSGVDEKYKFDWKEFLSLEKTYHRVISMKGKH